VNRADVMTSAKTFAMVLMVCVPNSVSSRNRVELLREGVEASPDDPRKMVRQRFFGLRFAGCREYPQKLNWAANAICGFISEIGLGARRVLRGVIPGSFQFS